MRNVSYSYNLPKAPCSPLSINISNNISETEILDRLLNYRQGKTTILISHRPQVIVIDRAYWIVLLETEVDYILMVLAMIFAIVKRHSAIAVAKI